MTPFRTFQILLRLSALACCLGVLASCSMIRLGYGHLDTYAAWKAHEYFDLDAHQKDEFLRRFNRLHEWHRYEQLPDYAAFLATARKRLDKPLHSEDVDWFIDGVKVRYARVVSHATGDAVALLYTITPAQLEALRRQWEKDSRRFVREYRLTGSAEDIKRARARRTLEQVREWVGALSPEQEARIVSMSDALPMTEKLRHEDRVRRQREFLQLMAQRGEDRKAFAERLGRWLIDWDKGRAPEYERRSREWYAQRVAMVIEIERMLTPHQRAVVLGRIDDYIADFARLGQQPPSRTASNQALLQ
ncbi:MAG TPA: DUF6279 family lipoprotein [Burkholderiales bacterium]|nr:DUF6279 family lipoprotein [Burkholderiales bacterium]